MPTNLGSRGLLGVTRDLGLLDRLLSRFALPLIDKNFVDVFIDIHIYIFTKPELNQVLP